MKFFADKHRQERSFGEGELVYLKLQPFRQNSLHLRKNLKLASKYFGPYKILEKIGPVAYRLDLPPDSKIHPVFHVSLLKKHIGDKHVPLPVLPPVDADGNFQVFPVSIALFTDPPPTSKPKNQVSVFWVSTEWKIQTVEDADWIKRVFPSCYPWGQGLFADGSIVRDTKDAGKIDEIDGISMVEERNCSEKKEIKEVEEDELEIDKISKVILSEEERRRRGIF